MSLKSPIEENKKVCMCVMAVGESVQIMTIRSNSNPWHFLEVDIGRRREIKKSPLWDGI